MAVKVRNNFWYDIAAGKTPNKAVLHKFGRNAAVSTTFVPVALGGDYVTPLYNDARFLRIKAGGNAQDTAAGTGARELTIIGLDADGTEMTCVLATAGASASGQTPIAYVRIYRAFVSESGTYADFPDGSHVADIVIEDTGGVTWATIDATDVARGQTEIGLYTIPAGKKGYLKNISISVESSKIADFIFFKRERTNETSAPFGAMREVFQLIGIQGTYSEADEAPQGPFPEHTDIGCIAKLSTGTGGIVVDYEIILEDPESF